MYTLKVYLYDSSQEKNGYRGTDYSKNVLQGCSIAEDLTDELDTAQITLAGLARSTEFDPMTKFIVDLVDIEEGEDDVVLKTYHFCVEEDVCQQAIMSDEGYFDHTISFIEPSVVAQHRLVDNISTTYKLKDVTLTKNDTVSPGDTSAFTGLQMSEFAGEYPFGYTLINSGSLPGVSKEYVRTVGKYFKANGIPYVTTASETRHPNEYETLQDYPYTIDEKTGENSYYTYITIPKVSMFAGIGYGTSGQSGYYTSYDFVELGTVSIDYLIEEFTITDLVNPTNSWSGSIISNDNIYNADAYAPGGGAFGSAGVSTNITAELKEWFPEGFEGSTNDERHPTFKRYTDTSAADPNYVVEIPIQANRTYKITISLHNFTDKCPLYVYTSSHGTIYCGSTYTVPYKIYYYHNKGGTDIKYSAGVFCTSNEVSGSTSFTVYEAENYEQVVYSSSTPYSVLALVQKAIMNADIYEKQDGVYCADVNNMDTPFLIDDSWNFEMANTEIIESFFDKKNLWEILLEAGNYMHAIPEIKFGSDDKFLITFNRLGVQEESEDNSTKMSIYTNRGVDDYISSINAYVDNFVQLGGYIEEWVVPKTTDDQCLVYADTAEFVLSKPILELINVTLVNGTKTYDVTDYFFEENVYKTLSLTYSDFPNRGTAMYYKLGDNVITGGQYQLPQSNTNIYSDYTIKKIIYSGINGGYPVISSKPSSGYWTTTKPNQYRFIFIYRTKDDVRQEHCRPDLKKYLMGSKYDKVPMHYQINNQTDTLVDSIKFGSNMFGTLVKTGNTEVTRAEWCPDFESLKHRGELYNINNDLYYVAKSEYIVYGSHFINTVTYSKDYNKLSEVIGIPSEPRFYEISEQSSIARDVSIHDYLLVTTDKSVLDHTNGYIQNIKGVMNLAFIEEQPYANWVVTAFKSDKDIPLYDQTVGQSGFYEEVITPVNAYSSGDTLTYSWDMVDNYSAGDKVVETEKISSTADADAYYSLQAVRYTDVFGKAALVDFAIIPDDDEQFHSIGYMSLDNVRSFPESVIYTLNKNLANSTEGALPAFMDYYQTPLFTNIRTYTDDIYGRGIILLKDCREQISLNYNLQMITEDDKFITSPYFFVSQKTNIKLVLLNTPISKFSNGLISSSQIMSVEVTDREGTISTKSEFEIDTADYEFSSGATESSGGVGIHNASGEGWTGGDLFDYGFLKTSVILSGVSEHHFDGTEGYEQVKSIVVVCEVSSAQTTPTIVITYPPASGEVTGQATATSASLFSSIGNPQILYKKRFVIARNLTTDDSSRYDEAMQTWYFGTPSKDVFDNRQ